MCHRWPPCRSIVKSSVNLGHLKRENIFFDTPTKIEESVLNDDTGTHDSSSDIELGFSFRILFPVRRSRGSDQIGSIEIVLFKSSNVFVGDTICVPRMSPEGALSSHWRVHLYRSIYRSIEHFWNNIEAWNDVTAIKDREFFVIDRNFSSTFGVSRLKLLEPAAKDAIIGPGITLHPLGNSDVVTPSEIFPFWQTAIVLLILWSSRRFFESNRRLNQIHTNEINPSQRFPIRGSAWKNWYFSSSEALIKSWHRQLP